MLIDLHIHSTASDGTDTPEQILEKISAMEGMTRLKKILNTFWSKAKIFTRKNLKSD